MQRRSFSDSNANESYEETNFLKKLYKALTSDAPGQNYIPSEIDDSYLYSQLNNIDHEKGIDDNNGKDLNQAKSYQRLYASKFTISTAVVLLGIRIGIAAIFWDQYVHSYQDILDIVPTSKLHKVKQIHFCD